MGESRRRDAPLRHQVDADQGGIRVSLVAAVDSEDREGRVVRVATFDVNHLPRNDPEWWAVVDAARAAGAPDNADVVFGSHPPWQISWEWPAT